MEKVISNTLVKIQSELKAPKNQFNKFGNFHYRSCEDILEALKPILKEMQATVIISDDMVMVGAWHYVKATVTLRTDEGEISTTAYAREAGEKKGMDSSQITGSTSSYARKYALNGLFLIDDVKDADSNNKETKPSAVPAKDDRENLKITPHLITEKQRKRLFAISMKSKVPKETMEEYLFNTYGYQNSAEIQTKDYEAICLYAENFPESDNA